MSRTYTITLEFEVKMTSSGHPASYDEPAAAPEFEIETCSFEGISDSFEKMYKKYKEERPERLAPVEPFDQFVINKIYDKVLDKAAEDDWSDDSDDYDPPDRD